MGGGEREREQTRETEKKGEGVGWVVLCFLSKLVLRSGQPVVNQALNYQPPSAIMLSLDL